MMVKSSRATLPFQGIDPTRLPRHVAIIMDGNGRWAAKRGLPVAEGHRAGSRALRPIVETSIGRLQISSPSSLVTRMQ